MPSRIEVVAIDSAAGRVRIALFGLSRPPETRLFVLTDDRGRRFVPAIAQCTPDNEKMGEVNGPSSLSTARHSAQAESEASDEQAERWQCDLTIAPLYRRANLTDVAMEWGDRAVNALPGQVRSRLAEVHSSSLLPQVDLPETHPDESAPSNGEPYEHGTALEKSDKDSPSSNPEEPEDLTE
jgi:hypothetical protein